MKTLFLLLCFTAFADRSYETPLPKSGQVLFTDGEWEIRLLADKNVQSMILRKGKKIVRIYKPEDTSSHILTFQQFKLEKKDVLFTTWARGQSEAAVAVDVSGTKPTWKEIVSDGPIEVSLAPSKTVLLIKILKASGFGATREIISEEVRWP